MWKRFLVLIAAVAAVLGLTSGAATASARPGPQPWHGRWAAKSAERFAREGSSPNGPLSDGSGTTAPTGNNPQATALDTATQTLYVANFNDGTVSVINAAACNATVTSGCSKTAPTVQVGSGPVAVSLNQATDTIYVANSGDNTVSVINGAACNAHDSSGCGQAPPAVAVGNFPVALDVNQVTNTVYVADAGATFTNTAVSVIDGNTCDGQDTSGCGQTPAAITVGPAPDGVLVDQATDTVYVASVAPDGAGTVFAINGATCNATIASGCGQVPPSVSVGHGSVNEATVALAIDHAAGTLYVTNFSDNTLSMIDAATCNATVTSGCGQRPPIVSVGGGPDGLAFDAMTRTIYAANQHDWTVSAIKAATCNATVTTGCASQPAGAVRTGRSPAWLTVDPATGTVYTPNADDNTISVVNATTCSAILTFACTRFPPTAPVGDGPDGAAVNDATHTVYVANGNDGTVSVIDGATCNAAVTSGCGHPVATITVGNGPGLLDVNQATDTIYVPNFNDNTVSVINGARCNATNTTGCGATPPVITVPAQPGTTAVDQSTNTVYVSTATGTVAVINGATCDATHHSGCGQTPATVTIGGILGDIAVNQKTNTVYTANFGTSTTPGTTVSVINGNTCNGMHTTGCGQTPPAVTVGTGPDSVAVDQHTNTVYVTNFGPQGPGFGPGAGTTVSMINGATCDAAVTTGCGQTPPTFTSGNGPFLVRVNQASDTVYVINLGDHDVAIVDGRTCNATNPSGCPGRPHTVLVGGNPLGLGISPATGTAYVANAADNNVSILGQH
jgi:YVTN family beta-propeller protein